MSLNPPVSVVPSEQPRTLRAITFVDLWNLLRGAKGALGVSAQGFEWHQFVAQLRFAASRAVAPDASHAKVDRVHLLDEGVYVYGAPGRNSAGPGSPDWLSELAAESGITVKEETTKLEKYQCHQCDGRIKIRRESGADAHLISDLLWLAWQDRYDVAIIVSGDHDLLPSIERIQLSGRKTVAALFDGESLGTRRAAHSTVSLNGILSNPQIYPADGVAAIYSGLPGGLRFRSANDVFPIILKHGHEPGRLRDRLLTDMEKLLGDNWFSPDRKSDLPEEEQKQAKLAEYRETITNLIP